MGTWVPAYTVCSAYFYRCLFYYRVRFLYALRAECFLHTNVMFLMYENTCSIREDFTCVHMKVYTCRLITRQDTNMGSTPSKNNFSRPLREHGSVCIYVYIYMYAYDLCVHNVCVHLCVCVCVRVCACQNRDGDGIRWLIWIDSHPCLHFWISVSTTCVSVYVWFWCTCSTQHVYVCVRVRVCMGVCVGRWVCEWVNGHRYMCIVCVRECARAGVRACLSKIILVRVLQSRCCMVTFIMKQSFSTLTWGSM